MIKWFVRVVVLLLALAAAAYPVADLMRAPMDDVARIELTKARKSDRFVALRAGVMHVRLQGPEDGPVVLLVHGASVGGFAFQRWIKPLADAGFRVIVPDMFGYGYSDRPSATYDKAFFMAQLSEMLATLNVEGPIHVVGTSMGGAISADFVSQNPTRVRSLTLIAPAGLGALAAQRSTVAQLFLAPVIGDWIGRVFGAALTVGTVMQTEIGSVEGVRDWMNEQAKYRGFAEAQQDTFRHYDISNRLDAYSAVGQSGLPVLAIWGTADAVVPFEHTVELAKRVPQAKLVPVEGKPHGLPLLDPDGMVAIVLPFLKAQGAAAVP